MTGAYDEKVRLAQIVADSRAALAEPHGYSREALAARTGRLEALLKMLADSAEAFTPYTAGGGR